mgnify:CR=1 FL=1
MFEDIAPTKKIGFLKPLGVIDNAAYEFYRLAPRGVMAVMIPIGLGEFSAKDVARVFAPLDQYLDELKGRGCDIVIQSGTPLPILIGMEAHDRMMKHMTARTGLPATSTVNAVVNAARDLGVKKIVQVNKWTDAMNATLADFYARAGIHTVGVSTKSIAPKAFTKLGTAEHMTLAYELGRQAFLEFPACDGLYMGGGAWIAEPVAKRLEEEFGRPVICNTAAMVREACKTVGAWEARKGFSRVMAVG